MRRSILVALGTGAVITSAAAISGIGDGVLPQSMTASEYESSLREVAALRERLAVRCQRFDAGYERDFCRTEAQATEMIRVAEIEEGYRRTREAARALQRTRIEARYQVDRARCEAQRGFKRDRCLIQAHAAKGRALLDAAAPYEVRF